MSTPRGALQITRILYGWSDSEAAHGANDGQSKCLNLASILENPRMQTVDPKSTRLLLEQAALGANCGSAVESLNL